MMPKFALTIASMFALVGVAAGCRSAEPNLVGGVKQTLKLVEHADTDAVTDLGPKGDSPGDLLTFQNPIFDEANQKQVGQNQGYCVRTQVGAAWECNWTTLLSDGTLAVEGPFFDTKDSVLAILGGTGAYRSARGEMKLHARDAKGTAYDLTYEVW